MNRISIKLKVSLWYTFIIAGISLLVLFAMLSVSEGILKEDASDKIIHTVDGMVNPPKMKVKKDMDNMPAFPDDERRDFKDMPPFRFFENGVHTAVFDSSLELIAGSLPFEFADEIQFEDFKLDERSFGGDRFLTYVRKGHNQNAGDVWVVGVVSIADESSMLKSVTKTNLILILILVIVAGIGGYLILKRAFMPVDIIGKTAKEISESSDLSQRIALDGGKDEIYRLARTFDEMLDKIEAAFEKEKQFTSDASHELRTPIAVINSECEYVMDCTESPDEVIESISSIKRQSDKMAKLIDELLTISRMDKNIQKFNFEDIDISELLNFVCDEQEEIHPGDVRLVRSIAPGIHAEADQALLTRLFINLISNAYKYGNDKIAVTLEENSGSILFSVTDNGVGISEENLSKIWERFYQVDPARTNDDGSMGLGLAMVKQIAEAHSGTAAVSSKLGMGAVFTFSMPKRQSPPSGGD